MAKITDLFRYPVKGLSPEPMNSLTLTRDNGIPFDREYALALGTTEFDPDHPEPLDKGFFLMLRNNEALAALRTKYDPARDRLSVALNGHAVLSAELGTDEGRDAVERFFERYMGEEAKGRPKLVRSAGHKFTDASVVSPVFMRSVSIVNLASIHALEAAVGEPLHRLRFRGNIYIEGLEPWEELEWVDREIRIGHVKLKGLARTPRCGAVNVNPDTAERDANLPKAIMKNFGHTDLGVFMEVLNDGEVRVGDDVLTPYLF
ncbi:molybdenum cofactor sulfurase [Terrihabitans soli]|uniref:Molybdenum cofactor sulfurase n=1 Tax=Terrihabitans soli TaxID=708113 RepID=A0A6S6QLV0_9HYPH|nr:MOSC domain-containing protein [Terrihabitans soli]BCJ89879.1 molybdenum cofactor sulfurase [Terrihabitans soli]